MMISSSIAAAVIVCVGIALISFSSSCYAYSRAGEDQIPNPYRNPGPAFWPGICQTGKMQSPIDLPAAPPASFTQNDPNLIPLVHEGDCFLRDPAPIMINENHKMQLELPNHELCTLRARDTLKKQTLKYKLLQVHFHTPSEHTFGGKYADFEIHLVHYASNPKNITAKNPLGITDYLVIGVVANAMPRPAAPHSQGQAALFDQLLDKAIDQEAHTDHQILIDPDLPVSSSIVDLLPANSSYYHYMGGFTTPPCTENVPWYVMSDIFPMWIDTLAAYKNFLNNAERYASYNKYNFTNNTRPIQKLNDRKVSYYVVNQTLPTLLGQRAVAYAEFAEDHMSESKYGAVGAVITAAAVAFAAGIFLGKRWGSGNTNNNSCNSSESTIVSSPVTSPAPRNATDGDASAAGPHAMLSAVPTAAKRVDAPPQVSSS